MGYGLVPFVASIILMIHHVVFSDASRWSKGIVATLVVASLVIWYNMPTWVVLATVMQAIVCVYVLGFQRLRGDAGP